MQARLGILDEIPIRELETRHVLWGWKWGRENIPDGSTSFWLLEAEGHIGAILLGPYYESILLLLIAVILGDVGLEELSCGIVLRRDKDLGFF